MAGCAKQILLRRVANRFCSISDFFNHGPWYCVIAKGSLMSAGCKVQVIQYFDCFLLSRSVVS